MRERVMSSALFDWEATDPVGIEPVRPEVHVAVGAHGSMPLHEAVAAKFASLDRKARRAGRGAQKAYRGAKTGAAWINYGYQLTTVPRAGAAARKRDRARYIGNPKIQKTIDDLQIIADEMGEGEVRDEILANIADLKLKIENQRGIREFCWEAPRLALAGAGTYLAWPMPLWEQGAVATASTAALVAYWTRRGLRTEEITAAPVHRPQRKGKPTETFILDAFRGLKLAGFKDVDPVPAGPLVPLNKKGTAWTQAWDLPGDMILQDIVARHDQLEKLLGAPVGCLKISGDPTKDAGRVILRVTDQHSSRREISTSPLAGISSFSINDSVVLGEDTFEAACGINIFNAHVFFGGMTQMGKTATIEALMAWLLLDPSVDYHELDLSPIDRESAEDSSSFRRLRPLAGYTLLGSDKPALDEALEYLRWLDEERKYRSRSSRHLVVVIDEFHELFMSPQHKGDAERLLNRIGRNSLKYNIHLIAATQRPDANSIPTSVLEQFEIRFGFYVKSSHTSDLIIPNGQQRKVDCAKLPPQPGYCVVDHAGEATQVRIYPPDEGLVIAKVGDGLAARGGVVEKLDLRSKFEGRKLDQPADVQVELGPVAEEGLLRDILTVAPATAEQIHENPCREFGVRYDELGPLLREAAGTDYSALTDDELRKRLYENCGIRSAEIFRRRDGKPYKITSCIKFAHVLCALGDEQCVEKVCTHRKGTN